MKIKQLTKEELDRRYIEDLIFRKNFKMGIGRHIKTFKQELLRRKHISESNKGKSKVYTKIKKLSEEHIKKIRERQLGKHPSEETKKKTSISAKLSGVGKWMKGRHLSEETKQKIKERTKGKKYSEEHNRKISEARKGMKFSEETKRRIGLGSKGNTYCLGNHHSENTKQIISYLAKERIKINGHPMLGKKHKEETKRKMKEKRALQVMPTIDTKIEVKIQNFLKQLNIEFFTHQYIKEIEHGYQCDILIPSMNMIIECDGNYWHKYPIGTEIDHIRTKELLEKGFKVLRLWEFEINKMTIDEFNSRIKNG